jgi:hypothetical protein
MQDRILTFFFLTACLVDIATQGPCDVITPCTFSNPDLNDQYSIHFTRTDCTDGRKPTKTKHITTVGTDNTKIIYSPGFIRKRAYPNKIFVEYSINCSGNDLAFIDLSYFHLPGNVCSRCSDYRRDFITVDRGRFGTLEMCGNSIDSSVVLELQHQWSGNLRVTFHTSWRDRYPGFEMYIICFDRHSEDKRSYGRHSYDMFLPTPEEQIELNKMNDVLFNAIPESADISLEDIEDSESGSDNESIVEDDRVREEDSESGSDNESIVEDDRVREACSENVRLVAERNLGASNPILRQQALSLQALLNQRREAENAIFTFTCSFMDNSLRCTVDDGFAPVVINGSYCTPNGGSRQKCDPFYGEFSSDDQSVTIEAINCDGQSARVTATRG